MPPSGKASAELYLLSHLAVSHRKVDLETTNNTAILSRSLSSHLLPG